MAVGPEGQWDIQRTAPILIKVRARPATNVKEVWAEGDIAAAPIDIQNTLCDVDRFTGYMPYLAEARYLGEPDPDGARYTYGRLELPVLSARDFVHKVYLDRDAATDPAGVFANHWFSVPTRVPGAALGAAAADQRRQLAGDADWPAATSLARRLLSSAPIPAAPSRLRRQPGERDRSHRDVPERRARGAAPGASAPRRAASQQLTLRWL